MKIITSFCIVLMTAGLFSEVPRDWETIILGQDSIYIEYVENGSGVPGLYAELPFHIDGALFLEKLYNPEDETNRIDNVKEIRVIDSGEDWQIVYYRVKILWLNLEYNVRWTFHREDRKVSWTLLNGDLDVLDGYWKVIDQTEGKCYVEYLSFTRPKLGFLNSFLKPLYLREMHKHLIEKQQIMK